jgi:acylphosphatase
MIVTGRVQGVGYRNWTIGNARALGVTGWVRNVQDGAVEILASGEGDALEALVEACREGPRLARVEHIEVVPSDDIAWKGFTKRFGT